MTSFIVRLALLLAVSVLSACTHPGAIGQRVGDRAPVQPSASLLVPGCPAQATGEVSLCQWRRATFAAGLYHRARVDWVIVSGAAVHTPYVEAEALRLALLHLGVPDEVVVLETQARHTDENVGYALPLAETLGVDELVVASNAAQAQGMCLMARSWGWSCQPVWPSPSERQGLLDLEVPRLVVPEAQKGIGVLAEQLPEGLGDGLPSSLRYFLMPLLRPGPPRPPAPEPSLLGRPLPGQREA